MVKSTKDMKRWVLNPHDWEPTEKDTREIEKCPECGRHVTSAELKVNGGHCADCEYGDY